MAEARALPPEAVRATRLRRIAEAIAATGIWVALGYLFDLGDTLGRQVVYLLLGIPFTIGFQLLVRRRPLHEFWVRAGPRIGVRTVFAPLLPVLLIVPVYLLVRDVADGDVPFAFYDVALFVGVIGAGYAARQFTDATWRDLAQCLVTGGLIGVLTSLHVYEQVTTAHPFASPFGAPAVRDFFVSLGTYVPAVFVMEEVWFRGVVDSHVHHPGERHGFLTALLVSLMWSYWHLPIAVGDPLVEALMGLPIAMVPMGIFLSIFWRRSGNLAVSGFTHAFSDSVRNVLVGVP